MKRTVIDASGRPRRMAFKQPPGYRTGADLPAIEPLADRQAVSAIARARDDLIAALSRHGLRDTVRQR